MTKLFKKFLFAIFLALLFSLFSPQHTFADNKINAVVHMQYAVSDSGNTHVTSSISLTNTTDNFYVSSYSLILGFGTISNLQASDPNGTVEPVVKQTPEGQEITLNFGNDVVAGLGKTLPFTLSFDTPNIASHNGTIWEINIPGLSSQSDFQDFSVDVSVPANFGSPTFIKPAIGSTSLHFTKDELGRSGISLTFGNAQSYNYQLTYQLENTNVFPVTTQIALPPTTNYQNVALQSINPKPDKVTIDTDGNWLATYTLSPNQKMTVTAGGLISVSLTPKPETLSPQDRSLYLKQQPYWQVDNEQIKTLAQNLKTPEAIYNYVVTHLTYDFNRVKENQVRLGALAVLQNPSSAVCLEFTDLFIALSRAAGIPAREIDGYGYTQNTIDRPLSLSEDILHAWPEYYDDTKHTWIMVDPTWGNTTGGVDYFHVLDFDHVAFVVKGASSTFPVPAGGYKFPGNNASKEVAVDVTQETITDQPTVSMQITVPESIVSGLPITAQLTLQNTGTVLFPQQPMDIVAHLLNPKEQFVDTDPIPPYGVDTQTISFAKTPLLTNLTDPITITLAGKSVTATIHVVPVTRQFLIIGGIVFVVLTLIIWLIAKRPWRI